MKRYKIFKRTTSYWNYQTDKCDVREMYFLKYAVTLFGIPLFWRIFYELECGGMGDCFGVIVYENDMQTLINRWNCKQNQEVIEELKT
jgi:hypothetical protein